ncbi:sulfatase [Reichenbachiella ulvae]|uniref:Sulfatase n=1 Tax=Reichenbachiella ulvae TaxID=2980104 RepID=A0ABT3D007_9BACT|nr:sulfatase [Reichenbachiella ulvae]MCV9389286.1 sulfatase [Reichenbachiella ulvae]
MRVFKYYADLLLLILIVSCKQGLQRAEVEKGQIQERTKKMNILFINDEDLSIRAVGAYGNEDAITPNLDRLADQSILFNNAICQAPMCNASRASFLTGLRPENINVFTNQDLMNESSPNQILGIASELKDKGAFLANIGKLYHGREKHIRYDDFDLLAYCKFPKDFKGEVIAEDESCSKRRFIYSPDSVLENELIKRQKIYEQKNKEIPMTAENWWFDVGIPYIGMQFQLLGDSGVPEECDEDYKKARLAGELLRQKAADGQQFFLSVGFSKPHTPIRAPKKYMDMYEVSETRLTSKQPELDSGMLPASKRFGAGADLFTGWFDEEFPQLRETPERQQKAVASYLASSTFIDAQLGYLLDILEETGLAENTIVVFMTDHGFHLGEHGLWSKYSVFDEVLRVPMMIKVPGVASAKHEGIVELLDLLPTLKEMWGLPVPDYLEGESLLPVFEQPEVSVKTHAFNTFDQYGIAKKHVRGYTIRTKRYRLTKWGKNTLHGVELYDFEVDPMEQHNVADQTDYSKVRDSLLQILDKEIILQVEAES